MYAYISHCLSITLLKSMEDLELKLHIFYSSVLGGSKWIGGGVSAKADVMKIKIPRSTGN